MGNAWSRRNVLRTLAAVGGASVLKPSTVMAQSSGLLERMRSAKVARVAIAAQPPYSDMLPDGTLVGLGPTVVEAVMGRLGVPRLEGIVVPYSEIIPGLTAGRWDFIAACLAVTRARCEQVAYAPPICFDPFVAAYPQNMADPPASIAEAGKRGLKMGIVAGGYAQPKIRSLTTPDKILVFPDTAALMDGMFAKRCDIAISGYAAFMAFRKQRPTPFNISHPLTDLQPAGAAPAFRSVDIDLSQAFSKEVMAMKASGEIAKMNDRFGFIYIRDQYDSVTMQQACSQAV